MSTPHSHPNDEPVGATAVTTDRRRRPLWWLLPLLLALAAIALLLLLSRCGNDDDRAGASGAATGGASSTVSASATTSAPAQDTASSSTTEGATTPDASASGSGGAASGQDGTVITEGMTVLGDGEVKDLNPHSGKPATGTQVRVQSVPADEGFWAGTSATDRIWVQLTGEQGESPYTVKVGDSVDFTGTVTAADSGFAKGTGLSTAEGAAQLTEQQQYIAVDRSALKLSD